MSVYFHANFKLNRARLAGVLENLINNPELSDTEIGEIYGYKAPFTKRYKSWLKKCGILKNSLKIEFTDYGKVIYKNDPKLEKELTLWYMILCLAENEENAEAWNFFHHTYLPNNKNFTKAELSDAFSMKLMPHDPGHFGKNAPMIKVITKVLIDSYVSEDAFGPLGIVNLKNGDFSSGKSDSPYTWNNLESFSSLY